MFNLCVYLICIQLRTTPKRHLIKIRNFLKKIGCYLEKYRFARRFERLKLNKFFEICTVIKISYFELLHGGESNFKFVQFFFTAICVQAQTANIFTRLCTLYNMTFAV